MKPDTLKALMALHAQVEGIRLSVESLIESEGGEIVHKCGHENAMDHSTMGMPAGARMWCPDCNQYFSRSGE
jgi:hypothetical protein